MKKKLTFTAALLSAALLSHAGVLFTENWDFSASSQEELDPARWVLDDGCFGDGIYSPCFGDFTFGVWEDGTLNFKGSNGDQGYWAGYALRSVPTFTASADKVLIVETKRISHTQTVQSGSATRTGLWLIAPDKSKWLLYADNFGEGNWSYNPYSGTASDRPVNVGYGLDLLNSTFASIIHNEVDIRVVANGSSASMFMRDPNAAEPVWVYGTSVPLNFAENIAVGLGVYTRAPKAGTLQGDYVEASFGPISVTQMDALYFGKDSLLLESGNSADVTLNVAASSTPCTVTLTSSDPQIVIPAGAPGGVTTINFAAGETQKDVTIVSVGEGLAKFTLTAPETIWVNNSLLVTVPAAPGVKLEENFDALDPNLWEISTKGYEYRVYPDADVTVDFFGARDGQLVADNMVASVNYWGGRSVVSKETFLGSTTTSLKVTADLSYMTHEAGVSTCANLVLRNADSSKFFALRCNRGEGGWQYNTAIGAAGTIPGAWAALNDGNAHVMQLLYDGKTMTMYVDGISGGTVNWVCDDPMFVEVGMYAREVGAKGSGAFDRVIVENIQNELPQATVSPATVYAFPQFNNLVAVTVPEYATMGGDVVLTITSSDPVIAAPETPTITFLKGGELTQYVNILTLEAGTAKIDFTPSAGAEWLTVPSVTVNAYKASGLLASDNFEGPALDTKLWEQVSRPGAGGISKDLNFWIEENELLGYFACQTGDHAAETQQIRDIFFPTAESPVIIEYTQGPLGGVGSVVVAMGAVVNLNNNTACAFGFSRGDITGWNAYPAYEFTTDSRPAVYRTDRFLDNGYHKVRMVHNGSVVRYYVDDVYGGSMASATDRITFALGGDAYKINNRVEFSFSDVKVYGVATIGVDDTPLNLISGSDTLEITVPNAILSQGTTLTLTIADPSIASFDTGGVKTLVLGPTSPNEQVITVNKVKAGRTFIYVDNDEDFEMSADTVTVMAVNPGELLFEDLFQGTEISTTNWLRDDKGWESTNPNSAGELTVTPGWGVILDYTLTANYWGGSAFWTQKTYKASKIDPLSFVVDRYQFSYGDGATGARCAILIRSSDGTKWIQVADAKDDPDYMGWVYNHYIDKPTGGGIQMPALNALFADRGQHIVTLVADGQTVEVYVDDVLGATLNCPVAEGSQFGFGLYTRQVPDTASAYFMSTKIYGSDNPAVNPPEITEQPADQFAGVGQDVTFQVRASGADLSYAWYYEEDLIVGATTPTLTINDAQLEHQGDYTVIVSNASGFVVSESAELVLIKTRVFSDDFAGPELDPDLWIENTRSFEYNQFPDATGTIRLDFAEALFINYTLTVNHWGGVTYYANGTFNASLANPVVFEVDREAFGRIEGTTGSRCSFVISSADGEKWINFSESTESGPRYVGWGYNRFIGEAGDNRGGAAAPFANLNVAPLTDQGFHKVRIVANGQTATLYVDGFAGTPIPFPISEGICFGLGVFARAVPDNAWAAFQYPSIWVDSSMPPTSPELSFEVVDGKLILRWAVSSGAILEVSPQASGGSWTHAGPPEIDAGTYYYEVPISSGSAYYRLVVDPYDQYDK